MISSDDYLPPEKYEFGKNDWLSKRIAFHCDHLARHLLRVKQLSFEEWDRIRSFGGSDFVCEALSCNVEVKGASNANKLKLFEDQTNRLIKELGFPFDKTLIWIFSYTNRKRKRMPDGKIQEIHLLSREVNKAEEVPNFLASHINVSYLVDLDLLYRLRGINGTSKYSRDKKRPRRTINVNRTELRELARNARKLLPQLGINGKLSEWLPFGSQMIRSSFVKTTLDDNTYDFEVIPLILASTRSLLFNRLINGRVRGRK